MSVKNISKVQREITRQKQRYHDKKYINFRKEADKYKLTHDSFIEKINKLKEENFEQIPITTMRELMPPKTFTVGFKNRCATLAVFNGQDYSFYYSDVKDEKNKTTKNPMPQFRLDFLERTGKTLVEAFGKSSQDLKVCVPQPIYYQNPMFARNVMLNKVCKEDFSSHYPSCAIGKLPDASTAKTVNKYCLPDEEYEFAFYPETGHIAIYNEFDTHCWTTMQKIYGASEEERRFKTDYLGRENKTILMKAAKERIVELVTYYEAKNKLSKDTEEYNQAKLFLNKFLGMFEQNNLEAYKRLPFAHLAAVIKWRANIKMFKLIKTIGEMKVIQVCVDGLLHIGPAFGTKDKKLGNLICEEENAKAIQKGINQYIVYGDQIHKCHAGLDVNIESDNINDWAASEKVRFIDYLKTIIDLEEI